MGSKKHKKRSDSSDSSTSDSYSSRDSSPAPKKHESRPERNISDDEVPHKRHKKSSEERDKLDRRKRRSNSSEERHGDKKYSSKSDDRKRPKSRERNRSRERSRSKEHKDKYFDRNNQDQNKYEERQSRSDRHHDYGSKSSYRERVHKEETDSRGSRAYRRDNNRDFKDRKYDRRRGRRSRSFDHANAKWGKNDDGEKNVKKDSQQKEKPNFGLSGKLTEETNTYRGVVIKYSEPPEARKPRRRWRLYPFKGEKALQTLYIHRESAYLIGRDRKVVDLPVDHPSCSKQHAALQYRLVPFTREDGTTGKRVRPYLIDLESANGTFINNKKIEPKKYVELLERDVIKFGFSSREYVLLHENSKDEKLDDDVKQEEEEVGVKEEPE